MSLDTQAVTAAFKKKPIVFVGCGLSVLLILTIYLRSGLEGELETVFEQKSDEVKRYSSNVTNSAQLDEQFGALTAATKEIETRAIRPDQLAKNLQYFYRIESELGVRYTELALKGVGTLGKGARYVPVTYRVTARGNYEQIINFIRRIEQGSVFARITALQINTIGDELAVALSVDLLGIP